MILFLFGPFQNPSLCDVVLKTIPSDRIGTGKTLVILFQSSPPLKEVGVSFMGKTYPLFPVLGQQSHFCTFQGISLKSRPANYQLRIVALDAKKNTTLAQRSIEVSRTSFPQERITIVPKKRHLLTSKALKDENKLLSAIFSKRESTKWWSGQFLLPVKGRFTSLFGIRRVYNDGKASWQHKGIDFSAKEGTRIVAPNSGRIALTRSLTAHGKTLVIDHGQGIFSVMIHMQDFKVKEGHMVRKGDIVGRTGKTGMANAPHLHWGLSVGNVRVAPLEWTEKSMERLIQ